jgi:S1-C subfamily serine protease
MNILQELNLQLAGIIERVRPSLVQVHNGRRGNGAGTIWHEQGLILTNAHVIARHRRNGLYVTLPAGERYTAQVLAVDEQRDLAALSIEAARLPTIEVGDSRALRPGDWVLALGHPWGVLGAVAAGNVIANGPPPEFNWAGGDLIQLGLRLRPGHSGGPLVDSHGRLVGVNMMISGPEVGMAIPAQTVKQFLKERLGSRTAAEKSAAGTLRSL